MTEIIKVLKTIKTNSSRLVRLTGVGTASSKAVSRKNNTMCSTLPAFQSTKLVFREIKSKANQRRT